MIGVIKSDGWWRFACGDVYTFWLQGTAWYTKLKYGPMVEFGNMLNYTAMGVGNHDFDDAVEGFVPFAERVENMNKYILIKKKSKN